MTAYAIGLWRCDACGHQQLAMSPVDLEFVQCGACEQIQSQMTGTAFVLGTWPAIKADLAVEQELERLTEGRRGES